MKVTIFSASLLTALSLAIPLERKIQPLHSLPLLDYTSLTTSLIKRVIEGFGPSVTTHKLQGPFEKLKLQLDLNNDDQGLSILQAESVALNTLASLVGSHITVTPTASFKTDHNQLSHVYIQQFYKGLPVTNGVGAVHVDGEGEVVFVSHSFFKPALGSTEGGPLLSILDQFGAGYGEAEAQEVEDYQEMMSAEEALETFANYLGLTVNSLAGSNKDDDYYFLNEYPKAPVLLKMIQTSEGALKLVWDIALDLDTNWFNAQVDAVNGEILGLVDWVSHATFNVFPLGLNDPRDGPRQILVNPENEVASPIGWNSIKSKIGVIKVNLDTQGNNVYAQNNPDGGNNWKRNHRPSGGKKGLFDFKLDLVKEPSSYIDATIVNLFYLNNIIHDLFYLYGFNEVSGNFQDNNFGKGGKGSDSVIANAQDGSGTNNANFATPPDGQQGRMRMYVWTQTTPKRDGDLEAGIVIHEYTHGISTRLTGGPANSGCLGWGESGGMGEGWGDYFATILRMNSTTTRNDTFSMGDYSNGGKGIRNFAYSTSNDTNPSTYAYIRKPAYWGVHAKGEVWAEILYEFFWNLVDKHGWEDDWFNVPLSNSTSSPGPYPLAGNKLALRLVVDGLKLQPCSPTFVDARDAILLADKVSKGDNACLIWKAFAKRGLGFEAEANGMEDFTLPSQCEDEEELVQQQ